MLKLNTLVEFCSGGSTHYAFIVGHCSYDGSPGFNSYAVRYVTQSEWDIPRRPYTIVNKNGVKTVTKFPEDFFVCGHWAATPDDATEEWKLTKDESGNYMIVPVLKGK